MWDDIKRKIYPSNPLGIIALFVFFIEAISTISLKFILENQSQHVGHIVWFIIFFPAVIVLLFFVTLWWKRESFYSPQDLGDPKLFVALLDKVDRLQIRQEATQLDSGTDIVDFMGMIEKLTKKKEIYTAIQVGRVSLREERYDSGYKIFEYLTTNVSKSHDLYTRILANLGYSLIGLEKFKEAINYLLKVHKLREKKRFYAWHAVALAYSHFKLGEVEEYKRWMKCAKKRREYSSNCSLFIKLYPEIEKDLVSARLPQ